MKVYVMSTVNKINSGIKMGLIKDIKDVADWIEKTAIGEVIHIKVREMPEAEYKEKY